MKVRTLLLTSVLMLTVVSTAVAQTPEPTKPATTAALATTSAEMSVSGTVVSCTSTELVMDSDAGQRMTFALDPKTKPATTFTAGERVTVLYHTMSDGTVYHAASVVIEPRPKVMPQARVEPQATGYSETSTGSRLPNTASSLPLIGLLGLLAMGGAVVVRVARP
ncbi:MAG TPA: hypothetical protein VF017_23970 [Thermoanaerobaculia bacterium]|nr:hypothetical protein [Thermoanaerobaculia bacterium]